MVLGNFQCKGVLLNKIALVRQGLPVVAVHIGGGVVVWILFLSSITSFRSPGEYRAEILSENAVKRKTTN